MKGQDSLLQQEQPAIAELTMDKWHHTWCFSTASRSTIFWKEWDLDYNISSARPFLIKNTRYSYCSQRFILFFEDSSYFGENNKGIMHGQQSCNEKIESRVPTVGLASPILPLPHCSRLLCFCWISKFDSWTNMTVCFRKKLRVQHLIMKSRAGLVMATRVGQVQITREACSEDAKLRSSWDFKFTIQSQCQWDTQPGTGAPTV